MNKRLKYLLLPLFLLSLVSCNVNEDISSNVSISSSEVTTLKNVWEIGYHHNVNGVSYYYSWYIDTNNGDLVIYDNKANKNYLTIDFNHYNIVYRRNNDYSKGYLYDYGGYYILMIDN